MAAKNVIGKKTISDLWPVCIYNGTPYSYAHDERMSKTSCSYWQKYRLYTFFNMKKTVIELIICCKTIFIFVAKYVIVTSQLCIMCPKVLTKIRRGWEKMLSFFLLLYLSWSIYIFFSMKKEKSWSITLYYLRLLLSCHVLVICWLLLLKHETLLVFGPSCQSSGQI